MQRIAAIATLTWKAAFRFRLFWVLLGLLLATVVVLPLLLKHDGTARGFTQILLTYTLSLITALLGLSTLWLACGTLARDIEDCQMQMIAVKPVARWQIWLGKWMGLMALNFALLAVAGGSVYALMQWRAAQLPADQQRILRNEIFVARNALKEPPVDLEGMTDRVMQERLRQAEVPAEQRGELRSHLREQLRAGLQVVPGGYERAWVLDPGLRSPLLRDEPLFVRTRFFAAQTNLFGTYRGTWVVGPRDASPLWVTNMSMAANTTHEFEIPPNLLGSDGKLTIRFVNQDNVSLLFGLEDGFEVLYREGGFGLNFARGILIIFCWLGLLAAIGLTAATFLTFPVAAFFSASLLLVALSSGTLANVVEDGTVLGVDHETGIATGTWLNYVMVPVFKGLLSVINLVQAFSPVDSLSAGRSITWGQLGLAFAQVVLFMGGLFAAAGMIIFSRRELATAQSNAG